MARVYLPPVNPIALRELRGRMRGPRTFVLLAGYMIALALVMLVVYLRKGGRSPYSYGGGSTFNGNYGPTRTYETGQDIFIAIFLYLVLTVIVVTPALCGGLISREMEEGTYDMLVATPVRGRSLVLGKLAAVLSYMLVLVGAAFPFTCVVFLFGGVQLKDLLAGFAIVIMLCALLSVMSLFFSGLFRRTGLAIIVTYSLTMLLLLGVPLLSSSLMTAINNDPGRPATGGSYQYMARIDPAFDLPKRVLVLNPVAALGSVLAPNAPYRPANSDELQYFPNSRSFWGNPASYFATPNFPAGTQLDQAYQASKRPVLGGGLSLWKGYLLIYLALFLLFLILSLAVVKPQPRHPGRFRPKLPSLRLGLRRLSRPDQTAPLPAESEPEPLG